MNSNRRIIRPVIAPGRVPQMVYEEIKQSAMHSGRSMAEELATLAYETVERRKRFPDSTAAKAIEMALLAFSLAGERAAQQRGITAGDWTIDFEIRKAAILALATPLFTEFLSSDPTEQAIAVEDLKGRIWTHIVNRQGVKHHD